jgi:hypothetical protein
VHSIQSCLISNSGQHVEWAKVPEIALESRG